MIILSNALSEGREKLLNGQICYRVSLYSMIQEMFAE